MGDNDADDEEEEGDESASLLSCRDGDDRISDTGINDTHTEGHEIEVPAEDFYDNEEADPEFLTSLHAFPLKRLTGAASAPQPMTTTVGNPYRTLPAAKIAADSKPGAPPNVPNIKYRFQHSGKSRLRPAIPLEEKECLATWVTIGDLAAWTLWDSGSTTTGITPAFAELAKVKVDTLDDRHVLQLGTVGSRSIIKYGADVLVTVAKVKSTFYLDIANFDRYDMIIGTPWMRRNKVILDFNANRMIVDGTSLPAVKVMAKDLDIRAR